MALFRIKREEREREDPHVIEYRALNTLELKKKSHRLPFPFVFPLHQHSPPPFKTGCKGKHIRSDTSSPLPQMRSDTS